MWSWGVQRLVLPRIHAGELHIVFLQSAQPADDIRAVNDEPAASRWRERIGEHLRERLALQIKVRPGISHRRVKAGVAEPLTNGGKVNAGFEQGNCGAASQGMRVKLLAAQRWCSPGCLFDVLAQEITNTVARKRTAACIDEKPLFCGVTKVARRLGNQTGQ